MAYGEVDNFDIARNTRYFLPKEIQDKLLSAQEVSDRLVRGEDTLDVSILKWERIVEVLNYIYQKSAPQKFVHNLQSKIGYKTCSLCISSIEAYVAKHGKVKYKEDKCIVCPLAKVDRCIDRDSAYMQIELILKNFAEDKYREPEIQDQLHNLRQNVQQMAIHLKSIKRILQKQRIRH